MVISIINLLLSCIVSKYEGYIFNTVMFLWTHLFWCLNCLAYQKLLKYAYIFLNCWLTINSQLLTYVPAYGSLAITHKLNFIELIIAELLKSFYIALKYFSGWNITGVIFTLKHFKLQPCVRQNCWFVML